MSNIEETNKEMSPDEQYELMNRTVTEKDIEPLFSSIRQAVSARPISAVVFYAITKPDKENNIEFSPASVGLSSSIIHATIEGVGHLIQTEPAASKGIIKHLKKIIAEAESTDAPANAN